ncbi:MAG: Dinitrogenase iron-molybdenum cofactor [Methanosaeta sp. PtaB.Bin018]|nr:dinitrogenase iron-molybdenum cofactor biosynthesis protein [Methanothrix sp.]OPX74787.1 MAG: Dinitrogenase iron-molybdenum cofactor [Methanosaeta sp. PtaB.Bin018]OPY47974.1 MAG: Dinitrogenase iron-molybdenum cofactor [Methanosaeta sp. PtaU1.Bin016]HOV51972.1 NifB/NifX family molybdenum-iron cluster-binding protein [Methanothrix sp.]
MKICVPTMGTEGMNEAICQHFGRAPTFTVVDMDTGDIQILPNVSEHMGGSGLPTETILKMGVQVMIVGGLGPKAVAAFSSSGVDVYVGAAGSVKDAIDDWQAKMLQRADMDNACKDHRH